MAGWLLDIGLFLISTGAHSSLRLARLGRTAWRLHRRLRGTREIVGSVEVLRAIPSPITREPVAAHRLTVEQRLEDGSFALLGDDTRCGELVIRNEEGPVRITGSVELYLPPDAEHDGSALPGPLPADEEDIRATEYLLRQGQRVHLLGLASRRRRVASRTPYRDPPPTADHRWHGKPVVSHWSTAELLRLVWRSSPLLPPDLRGVARVRRPAPDPWRPGRGDGP